MAKYIVLEMQTNVDNTFSSQVQSFDDQTRAENRYHTVLAAASISSKPVHAAVLLENDGMVLESRCYHHPVEPEPEPENEG